MRNYIDSPRFLAEKGSPLNTKIRALIIHQMRNTETTPELWNAQGLNRNTHQKLENKQELVEKAAERDPEFKEIYEYGKIYARRTLKSPESEITKILIAGLSNNNTTSILPTAKNLDNYFRTAQTNGSFDPSKTPFSPAIWQEYIGELIALKTQLTTHPNYAQLMQYAFADISKQQTNGIINDDQWAYILKKNALEGIIQKEGNRLVFHPETSSCDIIKQEILRRKQLLKLSPSWFNSYMANDQRAENDKILSERNFSSLNEIRSVNTRLGVLSRENPNNIVIENIDFEAIDRVFIDTKLRLYTGIQLGNPDYHKSAAGILNNFLAAVLEQKDSPLKQKVLIPALIYNLEQLSDPEKSIEEKATLLSKMAQGLGNCNTPLIDSLVMDTLVMPKNARKINNTELQTILEDKAIQEHFRKLISREIETIKADDSLSPEAKAFAIDEVKLTSDPIENTAGAVLMLRGQQHRATIANDEPDPNGHLRIVPALVVGMPKGNFSIGNNPTFAIEQVKARQMELLVGSLCKTEIGEDNKERPVVKYRRGNQGESIPYFEIDPQKVARITRKETRALELTAEINTDRIGDNIKDFVTQLCAQDENINEMYIAGESNDLCIPELQKTIFIEKLKKAIENYDVGTDNLEAYVENYKQVLEIKIKEVSRKFGENQTQDTDLKETTSQDIEAFNRAINRDKSPEERQRTSGETQSRNLRRSTSQMSL